MVTGCRLRVSETRHSLVDHLADVHALGSRLLFLPREQGSTDVTLHPTLLTTAARDGSRCAAASCSDLLTALQLCCC
jgi:hypothetical protein